MSPPSQDAGSPPDTRRRLESWKEIAWAARDQNLLHAKLYPRLDALRSDPRFEMLLR